jgi:hypothetical protein
MTDEMTDEMIETPKACRTCGFSKGVFTSAVATCPNCGEACGLAPTILKVVATYEVAGNPGKIFECEVASGFVPPMFSQFSGRLNGTTNAGAMGSISATIVVWLPQAKTAAEAIEMLPEAAIAAEPTLRAKLTAIAEVRARTVRPAAVSDVPGSLQLPG